MLFITGIFEETVIARKRRHIQTEAEYFANDKEKLKDFRCPHCKDHALFRGGVFIGCHECFNFFDEKDIIQENLAR